jgi:ribosomal protein RSM22 (predicted rRNA methylase)
MSALPAGLRQALEALLAGRSRRELAERLERISAAYRAGKPSEGQLRFEIDAIAYAVVRMPATFAAMDYALSQALEALPDLDPSSLLDVGCGPGTAAAAGVAAFPELELLTLVDRNGPLLALARELGPAFAGGRTLSVSALDLAAQKALPEADLVTAGYVLAEVGDFAAIACARRLWTAARRALVITEPGTPAGFARIRRIREALVGDGAHVAAPCTHDAACPMAGEDFCRVPVRVQRSRDHRMVKGGKLGHEDEPLAYLVLTRERPRRAAFRVVAPPAASKAEVAVTACGNNGLSCIRALARERESYKRFSKLRWGDAIQHQVPHASSTESGA